MGITAGTHRKKHVFAGKTQRFPVDFQWKNPLINILVNIICIIRVLLLFSASNHWRVGTPNKGRRLTRTVPIGGWFSIAWHNTFGIIQSIKSPCLSLKSSWPCMWKRPRDHPCFCPLIVAAKCGRAGRVDGVTIFAGHCVVASWRASRKLISLWNSTIFISKFRLLNIW